MANANIATIGRFSSQMLTNFGIQKTVKILNGVPTNTFKYTNGTSPVFPSAGAVSQADLYGGVVGNYQPSAFDSTKCYFLARGAGPMYADTMAGLALDMASMLGISPQSLLEQSERSGKLLFTEDAFRAFNNLRDPGNQIGITTSVDNRYSLQARAIRS